MRRGGTDKCRAVCVEVNTCEKQASVERREVLEAAQKKDKKEKVVILIPTAENQFERV